MNPAGKGRSRVHVRESRRYASDLPAGQVVVAYFPNLEIVNDRGCKYPSRDTSVDRFEGATIAWQAYCPAGTEEFDLPIDEIEAAADPSVPQYAALFLTPTDNRDGLLSDYELQLDGGVIGVGIPVDRRAETRSSEVLFDSGEGVQPIACMSSSDACSCQPFGVEDEAALLILCWDSEACDSSFSEILI